MEDCKKLHKIHGFAPSQALKSGQYVYLLVKIYGQFFMINVQPIFWLSALYSFLYHSNLLIQLQNTST